MDAALLAWRQAATHVVWVAAVGAVIAAAAARAGAQAPVYFWVLLAGGDSSYHRDAVGSHARFHRPASLTSDAAGRLYVADSGNHTLRRIDTDGAVITVAGSPGQSGSSDGVGGTARFSSPSAIVSDATGVLWVADRGNFTIRRVDTAGVVTTIAGAAGSEGGTDGVGASARFGWVAGLALDADGNLYAVESADGSYGNTVRKITAAGVVTTLAGQAGAYGDVDGTGPAARFSSPQGIAVGADGHLYVADGRTIRRVTTSGVVSTVAGSANAQGLVDGTGSAARLGDARIVAVDSAGQMHVVDAPSFSTPYLRRVDASGAVTTVAALDTDSMGAFTDLLQISGLVVRAGGGFVFSESRGVVRVRGTDGRVTTVAGTFGWGTEDGLRSAARFHAPNQLSLDRLGNLYVADTYNYAIRRVAPDGRVLTVAGLGRAAGDAGGAPSDARFRNPYGAAAGADGVVTIADTSNGLVRRLAMGGVTNLAGALRLFGGDDGTGTDARFSDVASPWGPQVAVDAAGTAYLADTAAHTIRRISATGEVTTLAGAFGLSGTLDGAGAAARFASPQGIAVDTAGTVHVTDAWTVRRISPSGQVTTVDSAGGNALALHPDGSLIVGYGASVYRLTSSGGRSLLGTPDLGRVGGVAVGPSGEIYVSMHNNGGGEVNRLWVGLPTPEAAPVVDLPAGVTATTGGTAQVSASVTGMPTPAVQWQVSSDGGGTWSAVTEASPYSGTSTATLTIAGVTAGMQGRRFRLVATNLSGAVSSTTAVLTVTGVTASPAALRFASRRTSFGAVQSTPAQRVTVGPVGSGVPVWTATADQPWLTIAQGSGAGVGQFDVGIADAAVTTAGSFTGSVTVRVPATGATATIAVTFTIVVSEAEVERPFGLVETPIQDAGGVTGAIAVSGWALDDVGISKVEVYRNCLQADRDRGTPCYTIGGLLAYGPVVYLGEATFVPGARPDVEAAYPHYPAAHRAGWGFMVLSNMLPNVSGGTATGGVGPVEFHVLAFGDYPGVRRLGRTLLDEAPTRVTLANDTIARPFGAIDTPGQGATVTGTINNFGWALTPDLGTGVLIPTAGSTVRVFIDGAPVGTTTFDLCRGSVAVNGVVPPGLLCNDDVSTAFRGDGTAFRNLDAGRGPIGLRSIDTTTLSNGLHTLSWGVTDSANRAEGIGSRYINVVNGTTDAFAGRPDVPGRQNGGLENQAALRTSVPLIYARTGFDPLTAYVPLARDVDGVAQVRIPELGRVELQVPGVESGALVVNGDARPLPIGVGIDADRGLVTWHPGAGFLGTYRLAFARRDSGTSGPWDFVVDVTVVPAQRADAPVRMRLDSGGATTEPPNHSTAQRLIHVSGWALDLQAWSGSGVGAVHVWARRRGAECLVLGATPPCFLARPTSACHGPRWPRRTGRRSATRGSATRVCCPRPASGRSRRTCGWTGRAGLKTRELFRWRCVEGPAPRLPSGHERIHVRVGVRLHEPRRVRGVVESREPEHPENGLEQRRRG